MVCGGISVGESTDVRSALAELGAEEVFWRVALRPGKPTYFGIGPGGKPVFGLAGQPGLGAWVTFLLFARLDRDAGRDPASHRVEAALTERYETVAGRGRGNPRRA